MGDAAQPEPAPTKPKAAKKAKGGAQSAKPAPAKGKATKKATPANASEGKKGAQVAATPRDGSKTAQVVAMLQRKNGATIEEIMKTMGWLRHTVRGFMAGAMKKEAIPSRASNPTAACAPTGSTNSITLPSTGPPGTAAAGFSAAGRDSWQVGPHVKPPPPECTAATRGATVANLRSSHNLRPAAGD